MSETKEMQKERNPVVDYLANKRTQLETILPKHITPEKFLRVVFVQMQKTPDLAQCTKESIYSSMMAAGERGLIPDGYHGHLIPFWKSDRKSGQRWRECQFIPDYKGIMLLARQSGDVLDVFPASIREHDHFEYELGFNRKLVHRPNLLGDRGDIVAVYCVVELKDGAKTFGPGPMTVEEIERVRARSRAAQSGPWVTDWEAMAWKTVIKRTLKFVAQSPELRSIIDLDDSQYSTEPAPAAPAEVTIEGLIAEAGPGEVSRETETPEPEPLSGGGAIKTGPEDITPKWPKNVGGQWVDSSGAIYDKTIHASYRGPWPTVNSDGTFRARRKSAKESAPSGGPAGPSPGESGDTPAPGAKQDDGGSSPAPDSPGPDAAPSPPLVSQPETHPGPSLADVLGLIKEAKEGENESMYEDAVGMISSLSPGEQRVANDAARAAAEQHNWPVF